MRKILLLACAIFTASLATAQEYKVSRNSGRLELNVGRVTVEGHNGNDIVFTSMDGTKEKDPRAEGLRPLNSLGLTDNTGLGINVTEEAGVIRVQQLKKMNSPDIKVLVPKGVIVSFKHTSQYAGEARFKNLPNEIEVDAQYNSIKLQNVTGPLMIKTIYGHVEASLDKTIKGPISIVSVYGYVDVAMASDTKGDLKLSTSYGEILVDPVFKIEIEKQGDMVRYTDKISGKINGGGTPIDLSCNYGKVYLRKIN